MKKVLILLFVGVCGFTVHASELSDTGKSSDIFEAAMIYASSLSTQEKVEVLNEGISIESYVSTIANEKSKTTSLKGTSSTHTTSTVNYTGGKNYTDSIVSTNDASAYKWSSINPSFNVYDDGGEDNVTILASAYTSAAEENGGYEGMNAIGGTLSSGQVAAPKDIPFHAKIRINGLGVFDVTDRGGAIVRVDDSAVRIDIWHASYAEAMKFGRRTYKGRIILKQ